MVSPHFAATPAIFASAQRGMDHLLNFNPNNVSSRMLKAPSFCYMFPVLRRDTGF
jgi:hypothetical protein